MPRNLLRDCFHKLQHAAHMGEKPLHLSYFVLVAWEASKSWYGVVAGLCAGVLVLELKEDKHDDDDPPSSVR